MKIKLLSILFLASLVLTSTVPTAQAALASDLPFRRAFLHYADQLNQSAWWQSHVLADPGSGRLHAAYFTNEQIFYASCGANCGDAASWVSTALAPAGTYSSLAFPTLSLDSSGRPRMMWYAYPDYVYAECNAGCSQAAHWKSVKIALNPDNIYEYPRSPRYFALSPSSQPRFISYFHEGLTYASCDSGCLAAGSWKYQEVSFGTVDNLEAPQLEITPGGRLVVAGFNGWTNHLVVAECSQNCLVDQNWTWARVAEDVGGPTFAMRLDPDGRPRLAFYTMHASDRQLYYAWSSDNFTSPAGWTVDPLPLAPDVNRTLDLAIDRQGRPHIVYVDDNADLRYLRCTSGCNTLQSDWWLQYVETRDDLDASHPIDPGGFDSAAWTISGYPSLALDGAGSPVVSYYTRCDLFSGISPYPGAWAVRFAAGLNLSRSLFLPFTQR